MKRLELILVLRSIEALIDTDNVDKAKELINDIIEEKEEDYDE